MYSVPDRGNDELQPEQDYRERTYVVLGLLVCDSASEVTLLCASASTFKTCMPIFSLKFSKPHQQRTRLFSTQYVAAIKTAVTAGRAAQHGIQAGIVQPGRYQSHPSTTRLARPIKIPRPPFLPPTGPCFYLPSAAGRVHGGVLELQHLRLPHECWQPSMKWRAPHLRVQRSRPESPTPFSPRTHRLQSYKQAILQLRTVG